VAPNCLPIAESNWSAKSSSPREAKRSKSAALRTVALVFALTASSVYASKRQPSECRAQL
jgi:hypothetical protein